MLASAVPFALSSPAWAVDSTWLANPGSGAFNDPANWNRTISPSIVNEARFSFSRIQIDDIAVDWSGQLGADGHTKCCIPGGQPIPVLSAV